MKSKNTHGYSSTVLKTTELRKEVLVPQRKVKREALSMHFNGVLEFREFFNSQRCRLLIDGVTCAHLLL